MLQEKYIVMLIYMIKKFLHYFMQKVFSDVFCVLVCATELS